MLQSTFSKKMALCAAGGAVAAMAAAGPAMAIDNTGNAAPAKTMSTELAPQKGGGKVHKGITIRKTRVHHAPPRVLPAPRKGMHHRWIPKGTVVYIKCKVRGESVRGNPYWYKLAKRNGWVNAADVRTWGHIPYCRWR